MKRYLAAGAVLGLAAVVASAPNFSSAQTGTPWATFHANIVRSGFTNSAGPTTFTASNIWSLPAPVESSPAVDANGVGYIGDDDHKVYAFSPANARDPKWTFKTNGRVVSSPTLSLDGKTLYVGSDDDSLYALDTATGKQIWSHDLAGAVRASPLLSADGSTLFVPNINGSIYALKASDGSTVWGPYNLGSSIPGSFALSPDGSTLYVAVYNGFLYAIPATGAQAGKTVSTVFYLDGNAVSTPSLDGNGNIYISTQKGSVESFSPGSATPRWIYSIANHTPADSTPALGDGLVVFGDSDGNLYDLSQQAGQPVWPGFPHTGGNIRSSAAISGNNMVYFGSDDGYVYAVSAQTGAVVWEKSTGGSVSSSPAVGPDGSLWVGSQLGALYRFAQVTPPGTPPPAPTATPGPSPTPTTTSTPGPNPRATATPSGTPTGTGQPTIKLKSKVKPGSKQVIRVTTAPHTVVRFRVKYPNGDHQSHHATSSAAGTVVYSYVQAPSKIKHNRFNATVVVKSGNPPNQKVGTTTYRIVFGKIDVSAEPRRQGVGHLVNIYVHTGVGIRVVAFLLFPNGRFETLHGKTGPHGFAHIRYTIEPHLTAGSNHKVKIVAKLESGNPNISTQTTFTVR